MWLGEQTLTRDWPRHVAHYLLVNLGGGLPRARFFDLGKRSILAPGAEHTPRPSSPFYLALDGLLGRIYRFWWRRPRRIPCAIRQARGRPPRPWRCLLSAASRHSGGVILRFFAVPLLAFPAHQCVGPWRDIRFHQKPLPMAVNGVKPLLHRACISTMILLFAFFVLCGHVFQSH